jgi:hypothetical protein
MGAVTWLPLLVLVGSAEVWDLAELERYSIEIFWCFMLAA